jgi:hypothetical protein
MKIPGSGGSSGGSTEPKNPKPPDHPSNGCKGRDPFVALGGGTCFNGQWYPPTMLIAGSGATTTTTSPPPAPTPTPPTPTVPGACVSADPFTFFGGGTCWNGRWLPPGMPVPGGAPSSPAPTPAPPTGGPEIEQPTTGGGCFGTDPFRDIRGLLGLCSGGDWRPVRGVSSTGLVTAQNTGSGAVVWGISADGQFYEVRGGLDQNLRVEQMTVPFKAMLRSEMTGLVAGSVVVDLLEIGGRDN